jgi:hypothetical protein
MSKMMNKTQPEQKCSPALHVKVVQGGELDTWHAIYRRRKQETMG